MQEREGNSGVSIVAGGASAEQVHCACFCACQTSLKANKSVLRMEVFIFINETGGSCSIK